MIDDRETKLPQWARDTMADLRRRLGQSETIQAEQRAQLAEYAARVAGAPASIELEPYRSTDPTKRSGQVFPVQTHVRIKSRHEGRREPIDVRVTDEGFVEVSAGGGQLIILPSGGQNVVKLATADDYEMARARDLQVWEGRVSEAQANLRNAQKSVKA